MKNKRIISVILALTMALSFLPNIQASAKVKLSSTSKMLYVGKSVTIKISGAKSVKWSVSNSKIRIIKKTKSYAKVKGISEGTATLNAKVNGVTYKCTFNVKKLKSKAVNKVLCEDKNIAVTFKEIRKGKIILIVKNKSEKDFTYGNRYVVLNGKTYYDDLYVDNIYSETEKESKLSIYTEDEKTIDYVFNGGKFSGRIYYRFEDSMEETDLKFSVII